MYGGNCWGRLLLRALGNHLRWGWELLVSLLAETEEVVDGVGTHERVGGFEDQVTRDADRVRQKVLDGFGRGRRNRLVVRGLSVY